MADDKMRSVSSEEDSSRQAADKEAERKVVRKIDRHLIPLVMFLYVLAFLDRSNIGSASVAGLDRDLHLSSNQFTWLSTIFYISYIIFEPLGMMWKVVPPHIWCAFCVFAWGACASVQAATSNWQGLMVVRFFLATFEAGFAPGVIILFSFFYLRKEVGLRCGLYIASASLANAFSGFIAYALTHVEGSKISLWRLLFLVEGIPCLLAAVAAFYFIPDSAETARFLNPDERAIAAARTFRATGLTSEAANRGIAWKEIPKVFADPIMCMQALMNFSCNASFSSLPVFLPRILKGWGYTALAAQGLTAPPYLLAFVLVLLSTYISDRFAQRALTIFVLSGIGATGYIVLALAPHNTARYLGVFLAAAGIYPALANIIPWTLNNQGNSTRRGVAILAINAVGQCGSLMGTRLYPVSEAPQYSKGMWTCAGLMIFNAILAISLRTLLKRRNERLGGTDNCEGLVGCENEGPGFRYFL